MSNSFSLSKDILKGLIGAPFSSNPLKRIAELGREALKSHTFTLVLVEDVVLPAGDKKTVWLKTVASSSVQSDMEHYLEDKQFPLDRKLSSERGTVEAYGLKQNGQGFAKPEIASKYGFDSMLSCALCIGDRVFGAINHFSGTNSFTVEEKELIALFANQAVMVLERLNHQKTIDNLAKIVRQLSEELGENDTAKLLNLVAEKACELLSVPVCIIWQKTAGSDTLRITAASQAVDEPYRKLTLKVSDYNPNRILAASDTHFIADITERHHNLTHSREMEQRGLVSMLSVALSVGHQPIGLIDIFTYQKRIFTEWEKEVFVAFANHAALAIQKAELLEQDEGYQRDSEKLRKLTTMMLQMTEARKEADLLTTLLYGSLELVDVPRDELRGAICRLDYKSGKLHTVADTGGLNDVDDPGLGEGIVGKSLHEQKTIRVAEVTQEKAYLERWADTRAELAIPLIVHNTRVRVGDQVSFGPKPIGVLNLESSKEAFSQQDEERLESLARQAAVLIERLEYNEKLEKFWALEKRLKMRIKGWRQTVRSVKMSP